jgi:hypothetical protein
MNRNTRIFPRKSLWTGLACCAYSAAAFAQVLPDGDAERQYLDLIEQKQEEGGITARDLIEPLTALGQHYVEQQEYTRAAETFARARQVMRVNDGFDSPRELPLLAQQVAAEEAQGNIVAAWELEQGLLQLAAKNLDSLDALPILLGVAEKRFDIWNRYRAGEHPPEIELGCYYDRSRYLGVMLQGMPGLDATPRTRANCNAGERDTVLVALLVEARSYQLLGVDVLLRNNRYASAELQQLVTEVLRTSHTISRRLLSTNDPALHNMMMRLLTHEPVDSASAVRRAEFLLQLADMNIVRARQARRMNGLDTVRQQYEQAWQALEAEGVAREVLDEMFAPGLPVMLPAFTANPLARVTAAEATGYIDVTFEVTAKGTSRSVEVIGSSKVQRSDMRELQRMLDLASFRPRMADGKVIESAPVTVRYYVNAPASKGSE